MYETYVYPREKKKRRRKTLQQRGGRCETYRFEGETQDEQHQQDNKSSLAPHYASKMSLVYLCNNVNPCSYLQCPEHGCCEDLRVVLAGEVESVDLSLVSPLVEGGGGLIVLQTLQYGTVYHHLRKKLVTVNKRKCVCKVVK